MSDRLLLLDGNALVHRAFHALQQALAKGLEVVILTGDLDALQLVGPHVRVLTSRRGLSDTMLYDEAAVRERYGLEPRQIVDFKALRGDSSDNIPGVPGI